MNILQNHAQIFNPNGTLFLIKSDFLHLFKLIYVNPYALRRPKLHRVLAPLSAIGLNAIIVYFLSKQVEWNMDVLHITKKHVTGKQKRL